MTETGVMDTVWMLLGAALIFLMQAGFSMVEAGFSRTKNAGVVIARNLAVLVCTASAFCLVGFLSDILLGIDIFVGGMSGTEAPPVWAKVIFSTMLCVTAATAASGAMAERITFRAKLIYAAVIGAVVFPVVSYWIWGGWLSSLSIGGQVGYTDCAGGTAVQMTGGITALIGAKLVGARLGKYDNDGLSKAIPGRSFTLGSFGVFILWFGWFGFSACSVGIGTSEQMTAAAGTFMAISVSAASGLAFAMLYTTAKYKKADLSMTLNGALAGLVAISSGCGTLDPWAAAVVGAFAGIIASVSIEFTDKFLKIDDPVGAFAVHGICGAFGAVCTGLFAGNGGLLTGGGAGMLLIQLIGMMSAAVFTAVVMAVVFLIMKKAGWIRITAEEELAALEDEDGVTGCCAEIYSGEKVGASEAVPVQHMGETASAASDVKLTRVSVICRQSSFEDLKRALSDIGITGITVTKVMGCGTQRETERYYRGVPVSMRLLPKIKVEVIVCKVPVRAVIDAARSALYTGRTGDGKIFVYDVENVVKIRTGEEGYDALQDTVLDS